MYKGTKGKIVKYKDAIGAKVQGYIRCSRYKGAIHAIMQLLQYMQ